MIRPLYKSVEPFMEVPKGFGFLGVIQYDDQEDKVQCHICGKWFKSLPQHFISAHKISTEDYRDMFSLPLRGGLTSVGFSACRSKVASRPENIKRLKKIRSWTWDKPGNQKLCWNRRNGRRIKLGLSRLASKNKKGLCPLQIEARYAVVKKIVGREPKLLDIRQYDRQLHTRLVKQGFNEWKKEHGITVRPIGAIPQFGNLSLIAFLRKWVHHHGKLPSCNAFHRAINGYPSANVYLRAFGSWQNALTQAGLK